MLAAVEAQVRRNTHKRAVHVNFFGGIHVDPNWVYVDQLALAQPPLGPKVDPKREVEASRFVISSAEPTLPTTLPSYIPSARAA